MDGVRMTIPLKNILNIEKYTGQLTSDLSSKPIPHTTYFIRVKMEYPNEPEDVVKEFQIDEETCIGIEDLLKKIDWVKLDVNQVKDMIKIEILKSREVKGKKVKSAIEQIDMKGDHEDSKEGQ